MPFESGRVNLPQRYGDGGVTKKEEPKGEEALSHGNEEYSRVACACQNAGHLAGGTLPVGCDWPRLLFHHLAELLPVAGQGHGALELPFAHSRQ
jgi:hypothetical protein